MTDQPVFVLGEELQPLELAGFETEAEFQELLARHPRVLDFGSLADGRPLRLVLVAREMGVSTSTERGPAYWLDHLFVDADGVPTLGEVKRATDTRIRREVVGQMLDYAANAARYWPAALLQRSFEDTRAKDGRSLEEAYGDLLGERSAEEFWVMVEERLTAGQMRLLFVADRIPLELRAIVEFLNRQMRRTDVYAVELTQYRGGGDLRVLVPRIHGEVATAAKSPSDGRTRRKTTRADMDAAIQSRPNPEVRRLATALLDHVFAFGDRRSQPSRCLAGEASEGLGSFRDRSSARPFDSASVRCRCALRKSTLMSALTIVPAHATTAPTRPSTTCCAGRCGFGTMWDRHEVRVRRGEHKHFRRPEVGDLTLVIDVM
ncbi:MmyB family transcriptional regulator [Streptomyces cyaneochromogenes]|uniref:MmyB family transcriptional regulator n=1 Tax=Streptomyces cyaneochromogenes TaxID=2496836 RepID=UPI001E3855D2|nr:hypothetical protein [Streptomyces cyaneochromogenes]